MSSIGRIPVQVIEIDQDKCALTYGVGACTATGTGNAKCFNTLATCQVRDAYTLGEPLTLRFAVSQADLPSDYIIPSVQSISTNPTKINIGGRKGKSKALGIRSQVTIRLIDHPHGDNLVDPYLSGRSYNSYERGTFWAKWLKRNPYYNGRALRVKDGYYGESLSEMKTRHYVIETISLPDSKGNVTIKAQDILRLADDDKAQAPAISTGKLLTAINSTDTTIIVTGGDVTNYSQRNSKAIRIGDEIIRYTSASVAGNGDITFSGCVRGSDGTEASESDVDDSVQACLEYVIERPDTIAYDLLVNYGGIDSGFINLAEWQAEADTWFTGVNGSRLLSEPTGVTTLLGELTEQFMFYIWWDDVAQKIRFKAIAPEFGTPPIFNESDHLLQNSVSLVTDDDLRISETWISYQLKTPVENVSERDSYLRTVLRLDPTASSAEEYGQRKVYEIKSPWIINETQINILSARILARYRDNPVRLKFRIDAKDRGLVDVASVFDVDFKGFVDFTGQQITQRYQVISMQEIVAGEVIEIEAIRFDYAIDFKAGKWMVSDAPLYANATEAEKANGMWWSESDGTIGTDNGYLWS